MNKMQEQVAEFHIAFELPVHVVPKMPADHRLELRRDLIQEELDEFEQACDNCDIVEAVDALGDLLYVVFGAAIELGIDLEPIVDEIHSSNMSKLGADGNPVKRADGKVIKGPNFRKPNLKTILIQQGAKL